MARDQEIVGKLREILDPSTDKDIVTLDYVKFLRVGDDGSVSFVLELPKSSASHQSTIKEACEDALTSLPWVKALRISVSTQQEHRVAAQPPRPQGLGMVKNIIAVSSCKGGVGKSTVAANLAYTLAQSGHRVGMFDADVYGPSMPTMLKPDSTDLYTRNDLILPLEYQGVKLMSFGYVPKQPGSDAAIMRGPMVTQVINQLLSGTDWGPLDHLIIDMPPGTGDIQLTLLQLVPITAAIIVTTPQDLSFVDVVKGIQMFDKLEVPTVAVVENMSYFVCSKCSERHNIFGEGARRKLVEQFGFESSFDLPLDPALASAGDGGKPYVLQHPDSDISKTYQELSRATLAAMVQLKRTGTDRPKVEYIEGAGIRVTLPNGEQHDIQPAALRRRCRCAMCIEEMTGRQLLKPEDVADDVYPTSISPMGNYAVAIHWSDGHTSSIYPYQGLIDEQGKVTAS